MGVAELEARCRVQQDTVRRDSEGGLQRVLRVQLGPAGVDAEIVDSAVWRLTVSDPRLVDQVLVVGSKNCVASQR